MKMLICGYPEKQEEKEMGKSETKMATLGRFSKVLLRSSLNQTRRQLAAAAAEGGEHSGKC